jgi:hypothetical protein
MSVAETLFQHGSGFLVVGALNLAPLRRGVIARISAAEVAARKTRRATAEPLKRHPGDRMSVRQAILPTMKPISWSHEVYLKH